jgi:hypothetical protein
MAGDKDFERRLEIIERGIRELDLTADPGLRATVQQLVQAVLELHGRSLTRLVEIVGGAGIAGPAIIDELGRDPLVSPLLLLHSLHPLALEARVVRALDGVEPALRAKHASAELIAIVDGVVRVRVLGGPEQKAAVERAIVDGAPDLTTLEIEGADDAVVGFVPIASLRRADLPGASSHQPPLVLTPGT